MKIQNMILFICVILTRVSFGGHFPTATQKIDLDHGSVPKKVIRATERARSFAATPDERERIVLQVQRVCMPKIGTTTAETVEKSILYVGNTKYYIMYENGNRYIVRFNNKKYVPYRLDQDMWQPWPEFWQLWPWFWETTFEIGLSAQVRNCDECDFRFNCPNGYECPDNCDSCYPFAYEYEKHKKVK